MTITVTGNDLHDVLRQVQPKDSTFITIKARPRQWQGPHRPGMSPTGCIVQVDGKEVPLLFTDAQAAVEFLRGYLEERDREIQEYSKRGDSTT